MRSKTVIGCLKTVDLALKFPNQRAVNGSSFKKKIVIIFFFIEFFVIFLKRIKLLIFKNCSVQMGIGKSSSQRAEYFSATYRTLK